MESISVSPSNEGHVPKEGVTMVDPFALKEIPQDKPPQLQPKDNVKSCPECKAEFSIFKWKHHCSGCGQVFCKACCSFFLRVPESLGYNNEMVNLCWGCFKKYNVVDFSRTYDDYGPPDAKLTIVFVSGALTARAGIMGIKCDKFRVLILDLPGLGAMRGQKLTVDSACDHVKYMIDTHVKGKKAIVGGYSMGGHFAMKFVDKYPDSCLGIVAGGCANEYYSGIKTAMMGSMVDFTYSLMSAKTKANIVRNMASKGVTIDNLKWVEQSGMYYDMWPPCFSLMQEFEEGYYCKVLSNLKVDVLFIEAEHDFRSAEAKFLEAAGKRGTIHVIKGAAHNYLESAQSRKEFGDAIDAFAEKIAATL